MEYNLSSKEKKLYCLRSALLWRVWMSCCVGYHEKIHSSQLIAANNQLLGVSGKSARGRRRELETEVTDCECAEDQPWVWF